MPSVTRTGQDKAEEREITVEEVRSAFGSDGMLAYFSAVQGYTNAMQLVGHLYGLVGEVAALQRDSPQLTANQRRRLFDVEMISKANEKKLRGELGGEVARMAKQARELRDEVRRDVEAKYERA